MGIVDLTASPQLLKYCEQPFETTNCRTLMSPLSCGSQNLYNSEYKHH